MHINNEVKLDFDDVLLRPMISEINSRSEVSLERTFKFAHSPKTWTGVPIIAANMDAVGRIEMALVLQEYKILTALHKFYSVAQIQEAIDKKGLDPKFLAFTTGIRKEDMTRLEVFGESRLRDQIDIIMVDVPNGYIDSFFDACKNIRAMFPNHIIMAGNVVTQDVTEHLIKNCGVDVVKVGIGGGSACTTRPTTGVGYPQLSAVMETGNAAHGVRGHVISDGGHKKPGDVAKAFAGGADFVMLGGMLAGHDQSGGTIIEDADGNQFKEYYGMSSHAAMNNYYGGMASHRASEGRVVRIEYRGNVEGTIQQILGGVRSCATYIGAKNVKEMNKRATFVRIK